MSALQFPTDILTFSHPSFEPLHHYTYAVSAIRRALKPRQKHWYHASLHVNSAGLTTTPMRLDDTAVELALDLVSHRVHLTTSRGELWSIRLRGQPLSQFWGALNAAFTAFNLPLNLSKPDYPDAPAVYDTPLIENYWRALSQVDLLLKQFQSELREETSPVQFWSHNFDLAVLWFSGRLVPGQDPKNEEYADEQMNFGFSPGDGGIPEPYFYITAYPLPDKFVGSPLPEGAYWHTQGWNGAVLLYKTLAASSNPAPLLLDFLRTTQKRGAELMTLLSVED